MEAEATVRAASNGVEKNGSPLGAAPSGEQERPSSISLSDLLEQHKELLQGLNTIKAQREAAAQRLKDLETAEQRTLGALIANENWITKIDPNALQQAAGG